MSCGLIYIAGIIAASSEDKNPMASLVKLFDPAAPPSIFGELYLLYTFVLITTASNLFSLTFKDMWNHLYQDPICISILATYPETRMSIPLTVYTVLIIQFLSVYQALVLIVHNSAEKRLAELKNTFPQNPASYLMKAETLYEAVTKTPSASARTPDSNISIFLSEFISKSIAPYFEKHMHELDEIVCASS